MLAALRRFARPAFACLAVAAVTGTFLAGDTIGSVDAALRTTYGRSLLLKLLLVALAFIGVAPLFLAVERVPSQ